MDSTRKPYYFFVPEGFFFKPHKLTGTSFNPAARQSAAACHQVRCKRFCSVCAWASYQIRKIGGCMRECRERFPHHWLQRKPLVSKPGMHHGTCVMHVPWCMSGLLTRGGGEKVPGIPGACATRNLAYLERGPGAQVIRASGWLTPVGGAHAV